MLSSLADAKESVTVVHLADQVKWIKYFIMAMVCYSYN